MYFIRLLMTYNQSFASMKINRSRVCPLHSLSDEKTHGLIHLMLIGVVLSLGHDAYARPSVPWNNQQRPTHSQADSVPPATLTPKLSLQTRISQSEMPIIKGLVYEVEIKYKDLLGVGSDCTERFDNVIINDKLRQTVAIKLNYILLSL